MAPPINEKELQDKALQFLMRNRVLHIGMIEPIRHGFAEILYGSEAGVFIREKRSGSFMLSMEDPQLGNGLLDRHADIQLLCVCQQSFIEPAVQKFLFTNVLECYQCVYQGERRDIQTAPLEIRLPTLVELSEIICAYDNISKDEIERLFEISNLYVGIYHGRMIGFIGRHLEGSIGLLNVFPEYQGNGFGTIMESFLINKLIDQGCIPYCQVESNNEKSINLHKKLGFKISDESLFWMF